MRTLTDCDECDYQGIIARLAKGGSPKDITTARDMLDQAWLDGDITERDAIAMRMQITSDQLPLELAKTIEKINSCLKHAAEATDRYVISRYISAAEGLVHRLPGKSVQRCKSLVQGVGRTIVQNNHPLITNVGDAADFGLSLLSGEAATTSPELYDHLRIQVYGTLRGMSKRDSRIQGGLVLHVLAQTKNEEAMPLHDGLEFLTTQNAGSALEHPKLLTSYQHRTVAPCRLTSPGSVLRHIEKVWRRRHGTKLKLSA